MDTELEAWLLLNQRLKYTTEENNEFIIEPEIILYELETITTYSPEFTFTYDRREVEEYELLWWYLNRDRLYYITTWQPFWDVDTLFVDEKVEFENEDRIIRSRTIKSTKYIDYVNFVRFLYPKEQDTEDYSKYIKYMVNHEEYLFNYNRVIRMFDNTPNNDEVDDGYIPTHVYEWILSGNHKYIMNTLITRSIYGPKEYVRNVRMFGNELYDMNKFETKVYNVVKKYVPHNIVIVNFRPGWLSFRSYKNNQYYAREIDLWFPEWEFGIECNGEYYHQKAHMKERDKIKLEKCDEVGFDVFSVNSEKDRDIEKIVVDNLIRIKNNDLNRAKWGL